LHLERRTASDPLETIRKARRLVDEQVGVIRQVFEAPQDPDGPIIFGYGSLLAETAQYGVPHAAPLNGSTSIVRARALAGAIGEAVERYSVAVVPYERLSHSPFRDVRRAAMDPRSLVLYSEDQYRRPAFPYGRFDEDRPIGWVSGYSLTRGRDVLAPASFVYMPYRPGGEEPILAQMITTGLACGNTLEEAILSGLCEVIERDAVMTMWHRRLSLPRISSVDGAGWLVQETMGRFARTRYQVDLIDVTTDVGIPAIVAVARTARTDGPAAVFASNASLDPQLAVVGALDELAQCLMWVNGLMRRRRGRLLPALHEVSSMEDHVLWATNQQRLEHIQFIWSSASARRLAELPNRASGDILQDIRTCVTQLAERDLEVVVVDVTPEDIRDTGLSTARVLVTGAQPLHFGYGLERISDRVIHSALPEGSREEDYAGISAQLNRWPHPFP